MEKCRETTLIVIASIASLIIFAGIGNAEVVVNTQSQINASSSGQSPALMVQGPDYSTASGYISFTGIGTSALNLTMSAESLVDLTNIIEITPTVNGTVYLEYNLPVGVNMYLNSVVITILVVTLTLSGTEYAGTGSSTVSSGISVVSGQSLYLSFVMDGNLASSGYIDIGFSPS